MAGIFGIINTDGKPVDRDELERMAHAMEYWGPHGLSIWCEGCAGLGHLKLRITPESNHERFPVIDSHRELVMVSAGRIDNRDELFGAFNTPLGERSSIPDSQLIFDAYRKWGSECVHHLTGDWNLAVWHKQERKLFVARDPMGISGLYYHTNGHQFIFASSLKGLLVLPQIPRKINELRIAQILVSWHGDGVQTAYEGILRLPPAHHITLTGSRFEKTRYHSFENIDPLRYKDDNEYIEHFRELFIEAVRCRLRTNGRVGSTLSSGLDSSSISAVAANLLKEKGIRLPVFTSVPMYECQHLVPPHRLADEGPLAAKLVEFNGNMDHNLCKAERISVLEGIRKMLWVHDQPFHAAGNAFWIVDMMENLQQHGCNVLLTGQFGNGTISWPTSGYTKQALAPQRPIISFDNLLHVKKFRQNILNPLIPIPLLNQIVKFKHGPRPWEHHSAIKGSFAEKIRLREHMQRAGFDPTFSLRRDLSKMQLELIKPGENIVGQQWQETGSAFSLEVRDPSMDKRIVEYCLAVPERIYFQNGQGRLLIRRAMEGIIPDEILWSQQRGLQAADINQRIITEFEEWNGCSRKIFLNAHSNEFLDSTRINNALTSISNRKPQRGGIHIITRGLLMGLWLDSCCSNHFNHQ